MKKIALVLIPLFVVFLLVWWLWPRGSGDRGLEVDLVEVDRGDITRIVSAVGSVRALNMVEVGSQLSGQIAELHADFNTPVTAGDLLARLDPQTFERRVQEAEANLAVARANVEIQRAGIRKAEVTLANARREFQRQESLVERGSVSRSALDQAEAVFLSAEADVEIAHAQLRNAEATVLQREAALEAARIDLDRTEIRSPIDGVVIERAVDVGQTVAASLQAPILFTIAQDLSLIRIEASVDEADIGSVTEGAEARFNVDAFPDRSFNGRVGQVRLAPEEVQNVVTYTVVIDASNPDRRLLPGMTASIDLITGRQQDVLRIDNSAVRFRPPEDLIDTPAAGPPGGGRNPGAELREQLGGLGVDEGIIERIQTDMREVFAGMRGLFQSGADPDTIRARIEGSSRQVLERHLNAEQLAAWDERQRVLANTRPAVLYSQDANGRLQARPVRLGLSDDRHTEIVEGDIAPGDKIVTRIRRERRD